MISCREWAAVHLGKPIKFQYRTRRSAERALKDPKRNMVSNLCDYAQKLFTRVCVLETILMRIKKGTQLYDFDNADSVGGDGEESIGFDSGFAGDDSGSGGSTAGPGEGSAGSDGGDGGTDGSDRSALGSSSPSVHKNTPMAPAAT